jgi:hypothetical protein
MPFPQSACKMTADDFHELLFGQWLHVCNIQNALAACAPAQIARLDLLCEAGSVREVWNGFRWFHLWAEQSLERFHLLLNEDETTLRENLGIADEAWSQMRFELFLLASVDTDFLSEMLATPCQMEAHERQIEQLKAELGRAIQGKKKLRGKAR